MIPPRCIVVRTTERRPSKFVLRQLRGRQSRSARDGDRPLTLILGEFWIVGQPAGIGPEMVT